MDIKFPAVNQNITTYTYSTNLDQYDQFNTTISSDQRRIAGTYENSLIKEGDVCFTYDMFDNTGPISKFNGLIVEKGQTSEDITSKCSFVGMSFNSIDTLSREEDKVNLIKTGNVQIKNNSGGRISNGILVELTCPEFSADNPLNEENVKGFENATIIANKGFYTIPVIKPWNESSLLRVYNIFYKKSLYNLDKKNGKNMFPLYDKNIESNLYEQDIELNSVKNFFFGEMIFLTKILLFLIMEEKILFFSSIIEKKKHDIELKIGKLCITAAGQSIANDSIYKDLKRDLDELDKKKEGDIALDVLTNISNNIYADNIKNFKNFIKDINLFGDGDNYGIEKSNVTDISINFLKDYFIYMKDGNINENNNMSIFNNYINKDKDLEDIGAFIQNSIKSRTEELFKFIENSKRTIIGRTLNSTDNGEIMDILLT